MGIKPNRQPKGEKTHADMQYSMSDAAYTAGNPGSMDTGNVGSLSARIRQTLKRRLAEEIPAWNGRVGDIPAPGEVLSGPCAVVAFAEEVPKSAWAGYRRIIHVYPYARSEDGGAEQVEAWSAQLIAALHQARLEDDEGGAFTCIYVGSRECDRIDQASGMITRSLRFAVYVPEPADHAPAIPSDPWMQAMLDWTSKELGKDWAVYADVWPRGYENQTVLWRLAGSSTSASGTNALELRKQWIGHIVASGEEETRLAVTRLVEQFGVQARIPLSIAGGTRYATVDEVSADLQADAYLNGQIRLTLQQRIRRSEVDAPLMQAIHHKRVLE